MNNRAGVLKSITNRSRGVVRELPHPDPSGAVQSNVYKVRADRDAAPLDWPGPGPIDLRIHERPHASATTEWWYVNGHCESADGREFSLFAAFFRLAIGRDPETGACIYAHSVTWAISDLGRKRYLHFCGVDPVAPREGLKRIKRGLGSRDPRLNRALAEILERDNVPSPDKILRGQFFIAEDKLELDYSGQRLYRQDDGTYRLTLSDEAKGFGLDVVLTPRKGPIRHGDDGVVRGPENEKMFYYFMPRCELKGQVSCDGHAVEVEGSAWHDHEFGTRTDDFIDDEADAELDPALLEHVQRERRTRKEDNLIGWNWLSTQLDDGTDLTLYPLTFIKSGESAGAWTIVVDAEGNRSTHADFSLEPVEYWQSTQTFAEYPIKWRCRIPSAGLDLEVVAAFEDQEFITLISKSSFWEGRVNVRGTHGGKPVTGRGFIERSGFTLFESLDDYFNSVGRVVRKQVRDLIPLEPSYEQARRLVASEQHDHFMDGVDIEQYARTMIRPIRDVVDRGGKGWRSYAAITCIDIVGGDSRNFVQWIAVPEMMHVGSLIVDDVQDKSEIRRGAPTAHMVYGEAQAINSGTAAYFLGTALLGSERMSDRNKLRVYELYFESMRAGHAGQAIDIDGFEPLMTDIVETGNAAHLERRVLAVHRLKTAAPAGCLARMGAIAGGGTDEQVEGLGHFFESVGLAFQIIDDVLNLRGFKGDLKLKGEDIMQGKLTLPVVKALSRLDREERTWLWTTLRQKPQDPAVVKQVIDRLERVGAIDDCEKQARDLVEAAWKRLDPLVDDSLAKMMLRAFGWFVLERHY